MRLIVFFDLPVKTKVERQSYLNFRKFLLKNGYVMIQYSVYSRICSNNDSVEKHYKRLKKYLPRKGSIRALIITEKQYSNMKSLLGEKTIVEKSFEQLQLDIY